MIDFDAFAEDVLSTDAFGEPVIYRPSGGQGRSINVVFAEPFASVQGLGEVGVGSSSPSVICKSSDVEDAARGGEIIRDEITWYVVEPQPEDGGFTRLILSKD